jgi:hypothetical protein
LKKAILVLIFASIGFLVSAVANAMEFRLFTQPETREKVVIGEGEIMPGDADKFERFVKLVERDKYGNIVFVLNSPGGSVVAAFELAKKMEEIETTVYVPDNAKCASACASILYVSAEHHLVLGSGKLGFHTCYRKSGGTFETNSFCNERIAENAFEHGTSYAAVDMFTYDYGPAKMAWVDRTLACQIGLCRPYTEDDPLAEPSFDCKSVSLTYQKSICNDRRLAKYEAKNHHLADEITRKYGASESDDEAALDAVLEACPEADNARCVLRLLKQRQGVLYKKLVVPLR